jgi:hypothetical protein
MCPAAGDSSAQTNQWLHTAALSTAARINAAAPGAHFKPEDVYNIMMLCPFETVAKEMLSRWCELFERDEWEVFEYAGDLDKYYGTGYVYLFVCSRPLHGLTSSHHPPYSYRAFADECLFPVMANHSAVSKAQATSTSSSPASLPPQCVTTPKPTAP